MTAHNRIEPSRAAHRPVIVYSNGRDLQQALTPGSSQYTEGQVSSADTALTSLDQLGVSSGLDTIRHVKDKALDMPVSDPVVSRFLSLVDLEVAAPETPLRTVRLGPGDGWHLPPGTRHRLTAVEDTDILEVSTPELDDVVRLEDRYGRS